MKLTPAGAELFALMTWSRAFDAPIPLPDGGEITTLREAGEYLGLSWEPPQFGRQVRLGSKTEVSMLLDHFRFTLISGRH